MSIIQIQHLYKTFGTGENAVHALEDISLDIQKGEIFGIIGLSGAGKSTIIELVSRFYDVQEGEVLIGGRNVKELDYDTILKNVAIVFQKTFLTRDSVLENIRMGSSASLEEVRAAAKEAQIDDFIMSLPDGYDSFVGERGTRLSGGQKQRVAIARAMANDPAIILADEPTGNLDSKTSMDVILLMQSISRQFHQTTIMITHNEEIAQMADRTIRIEDGKVVSGGVRYAR